MMRLNTVHFWIVSAICFAGVFLFNPTNILKQNVCTLCLSAYTQQDGVCKAADTQVNRWNICQICERMNQTSEQVESLLLSAQDFEGDSRFKYQFLDSLESDLYRYHNVESGQLMDISTIQLSNTVKGTGDVPVIVSSYNPNVATSFSGFQRLFWNTSISTTVSLPPNDYIIEVYGHNDAPGPVILQIFANDMPVGLLSFESSDNSWESKCLRVSKMHTQIYDDEFQLRIRYTNDGGGDGDRDAAVAWVQIIQQK